MAVKYFQNQSNDWNDVNNWTGAAKPVTGDSVIFDTGAQAITTGLNQSAVNNLDIRFGPGYGGAVGLSGTDLQVGTGTELHFMGESMTACFIDLAGGDVWVRGTSSAANALVLSGTVATCAVQRCKSFTLQATTTTLNIEHAGNPFADVVMTVDQTATVTNWLQVGGVVTADKVATTVWLVGGQLTWTDSSGATLTTLYVVGQTARFDWHAKGSTITNANVYQGTLTSVFDPTSKTMTNGVCHAGGFMLLDNGNDSIIGPGSGIDNWGGVVLAGPSVTVNSKLTQIARVASFGQGSSPGQD